MSTIAPGCWRRLFYVDKSAFFCLLKGWSNNFKQYDHIDAQYLSTPHRIALHTARVGSSPQQQPAASIGFTSAGTDTPRSEEHTSELQSLMRISYAVFCLKKKTITTNNCNYKQDYRT